MTVGIIGAMDVEVAKLKEHMARQGSLGSVKSSGLEFFIGHIAGKDVCLVQCGVGMVNAAVATHALIELFHADAVINTGVAGSLDASIDIGDVVVASDAVNHVMDVCNLGYAAGQIPGFEKIAFECDENLANVALKAAKEAGLTAHRGRVASGDRFVRTQEDKDRIRTVFEARCCEMEGAAIAQVCSLIKVPFVIVRAISDKADGTDYIDYDAFERQAAQDCATLTINMLALL